MQIKDLLQFNPEAELNIIMEDGMPFSGELSLGWINGDGEDSDSPVDSRKIATNVCILLNERKENENNN